MYSGLTVRAPDPVPPVTAPTTVKPAPGVKVGTELCATAPKMSSDACVVVTGPEFGLVLLPDAVADWSTTPPPRVPVIALALATLSPLKPGYVAVTVSPTFSAVPTVAEQTKRRP